MNVHLADEIVARIYRRLPPERRTPRHAAGFARTLISIGLENVHNEEVVIDQFIDEEIEEAPARPARVLPRPPLDRSAVTPANIERWMKNAGWKVLRIGDKMGVATYKGGPCAIEHKRFMSGDGPYPESVEGEVVQWILFKIPPDRDGQTEAYRPVRTQYVKALVDLLNGRR